MSTPENKTPSPNPTSDPKVDATGQDIVTNNEESDKVVNQDGAVADMDGIQETLSRSEPSAATTAGSETITNDDSDVITNNDAADDITPEN